MKVLVTGATGFIGNHLIEELIKNREYSVIASSRNTEKAKNFNWFDRVEYIEYELYNKTEKRNLYELFNEPDILLHFAWSELEDYNSLSHIENELPNSFKFIKNLVQNGLKDVVVAGTCFEYGLQNGSLSEELNTKPSNSYGIAKDSLRKFLIELKKSYDFNYKWIRFFYMYGKGQSSNSLISLIDKAIKNNEKSFNMSGGEQLRDYLEINEVIENIILILQQKEYINQPINCCSGKPISIRKFVEDYLKTKGYNLNLNLGYYPYQDYEPMAFWGDNKKLENIKKVLL